MQNLLLQSALEVASFNLKVMPVYQVDPSGRCACWKGARCTSPGKHPRINDWQRQATDDEETICGWWSRWPLSNLGIQWGPRSHAIDVEFDSEAGRASADKYLGGIVTPSYESGRSIHRIFRYVPVFAGLGATKSGEKVEHLEFRIGADGKGAQSVAPPSRHYSGRVYSWLPSLGISEVAIAEPPQSLIDLILRWHAFRTNGTDARPKVAPTIAVSIPHGHRYKTLLSLAGTMRRRGLVAEEMVPSLRAVAARRFQHVPGDEIDVDEIAAGICQYDPGDPILIKPDKLVRSAREAAAARLHPAVQRARRHAITHRRKVRRRR